MSVRECSITLKKPPPKRVEGDARHPFHMIPPVKRELRPEPSLQTPSSATAALNAQPSASFPHQAAAPSMTTTNNNAEAALEVTQQPPETWYKDQNGRKATFDVRVRRTDRFCVRCMDQRHLTVHLLYESGKLVENQSIAHIAAGLCLNKDNESTISIRIMEVSKNHQNQRFRLRIVVPPCPNSCAPANFIVSDAVLVLSKKNKRPVKSDAEGESPAKVARSKKTKCADTMSPSTPVRWPSNATEHLKPSPSAVATNVSAAIAEFAASIPSAEASSTAPFTPNTPNVCLWANAAFDLLHKLQWQRAPPEATASTEASFDDILAQASSKAFRCPSCQETYGQVPIHREDCDLKLLLEQGGQTDTTTQDGDTTANNFTGQHALQKTPEKQTFAWPAPSKSEMHNSGCVTPRMQQPPAYNITQELLQFSEPGGGYVQPATGPVAVENLAKSINLNSWDGYSTLSKFMISAELDGRGFQEGFETFNTQQSTGPLPPVGTLSPGFPAFPNGATNFTVLQSNSTQNVESQRFSTFVASTKNMSADAAGLLQEGEAELNGDANLLFSLSKVSLSEFLKSNPGEPPVSDPRLAQVSSSLSALLGGDQPMLDTSSEQSVHAIVASDFRHCGFPAFDASFRLVGFYCLLTATQQTQTELRFMPNLYPLPAEMLKELEQAVAEWKKDPAVFRTRVPGGEGEQSLAVLKRAVLDAPECSHFAQLT